MTDQTAFSATVEGRVQGVGFRYSTRRQAHRLGVSGVVENRPDGTVYVECEGDKPAVQQMASWLKHGPGTARVTNVDIHWCSPRGHSGFSAR